ncbi:MAG: hypothetical protein OXI58_13270 [Gemmatimonadota bacterium]|nr:hypothetical protein [Gemmatimonadota bacterium]
MYLTAHRVRQTRVQKPEIGINAFLHKHDERTLPKNTKFYNEEIIDQIANNNTGELVAESTDIVPGGNSILSFIDIVGREDLDKERIQDFLNVVERDIEVEEIHAPIFKSASDFAVRFGITYGLKGQKIKEYKALTERAMILFESPEPPKWRSDVPWIEIHYSISDCQEIFSLSPETANKLKQMHGEFWIPKRVLLDPETKIFARSMYGDLVQYIAPALTGLTLEKIAAQGGLTIHDLSSRKKIKWPELKERPNSDAPSLP